MSSHKFQVGDQVDVKSRRRQGIVVAQSTIDGQLYYRIDLGTGSSVTVDESDLEPARSLLGRLAVGEYGHPYDFDLMTLATFLSFAYRYEELSCLSNSRLEPKPYQIFVAHRVLQDLHPRYILADEVGLGKTIEAGLILKELKARGLAEKVLIVVPASLREQWRGELETKFNERFYIYDSSTIKENLSRSPRQNPWARDPCIITSLQFARQQTSQANLPTERKQRAKTQSNRWIDQVDWDLVIFDEAHHLRRYLEGTKLQSGSETTKSYRLGQTLAEKAQSLLLLTATPMQLSPYEAFSLFELVDSSLFRSYGDFQQHRSVIDNNEWQTVMVLLSCLSDSRFYTGEQPSANVASMFTYTLKNVYKLGLVSGFWDGLVSSCLRLPSYNHQDDLHGEIASLKKSIEELLGPSGEFRTGIHNQPELMQALFSFSCKYREAFSLLTENLHKFSRVMIRNRKREVLKGEFVERQAHKIEVKLTADERELYESVSNYIRSAYARVTGQTMALGFVLTTFRKLLVSSRHALAASLERRAERIEEAVQAGQKIMKKFSKDELEEWNETLESVKELDELLHLTGGLSPEDAREEANMLRGMATWARKISVDSKADKLLTGVQVVLDGDPAEKVLIFTQFRETQSYLQELFRQRGYQVTLFHGADTKSGYNKRREFERFKKDPNIRIMISTEVGGEGLNFQFCHIMFNYDLPWNPMRIEQRIGRLDRIGQKRNVQIYNFFLEGTLDARILTVLQDRIRLFEETIGNLDPILGEVIEQDIENIVMADEADLEHKMADFEELAERRVHAARDAEVKMADFVMDAQSFRRDVADQILGRKQPVNNRNIELFARTFLGRYPQSDLIKVGEGHICTITVPERFRRDCSQLYDIYLDEKYRGTFDPPTAIEEDTVDFFAFGHPLFDAMIRYCTDAEKNNHFDGQVTVRVLHHADCDGYEGVQFNYILNFGGIRGYKKMIPVVLDLEGDYDPELSHQLLAIPAEEVDVEHSGLGWSLQTLQRLDSTSWNVIKEIAEQEIKEAEERNSKNYSEMEERLLRLYDYRLRNQQAVLEQRQKQLEDVRQRQLDDAQQQGQVQLRLLEGQVRATRGRIRELERQRDEELAELQKREDVKLSIDLLNVAYVKVERLEVSSEKAVCPHCACTIRSKTNFCPACGLRLGK